MRFPRRTLLASFTALVATAALAALKAGDVAPAFTAPASFAGKPFTYSLKASLAKGPVVVYFYPSAYTSGCNVQAHEFSTKSEQFAAAGASVVGVSLDSIERLNAFSADPDYCAGKLAVASDADGRIARSFGLRVTDAQPGATDTRGKEIDHGFTERTTFVVRKDGTIAATVGGVSPTENVARALEQVRKLASR
jgi:peroxiredoxin Q/BCP